MEHDAGQMVVDLQIARQMGFDVRAGMREIGVDFDVQVLWQIEGPLLEAGAGLQELGIVAPIGRRLELCVHIAHAPDVVDEAHKVDKVPVHHHFLVVQFRGAWQGSREVDAAGVALHVVAACEISQCRTHTHPLHRRTP